MNTSGNERVNSIKVDAGTFQLFEIMNQFGISFLRSKLTTFWKRYDAGNYDLTIRCSHDI